MCSNMIIKVSGKSIIINAIDLLMGSRFNKNMIRTNEDKCIIEGVFTGLKAIFKEQVDEWRSRLLINLIGRINKIEIHSQMIEKA